MDHPLQMRKILGKYILRRGHHNPFLIGMRQFDRITVFICNVVLLLRSPAMFRAFNRLPAIGQSSAPMTEGCLVVRIFARLLSRYHNNTVTVIIDGLCDFKPVFVKDRQPRCGKRDPQGRLLGFSRGEEAQAPKCQQIMAASPKPPRGEPEYRSTTDCRRPPDIVASPSRGRPSNRPS